MEEKFIFVKMQDLLNEDVFHTIKMSQKQALGLGHYGYGGRATDQHGKTWKWDSSKNAHVLVDKTPPEEAAKQHESPLKPHIENQAREIEKHVGALKADVEKKEEIATKPSFSDRYVPFRKRDEGSGNETHSTKVYGGEEVKVGQHLIGTHGHSSEVYYKVTKIEKSENPQRMSDKIHTINDSGDHRIHLADEINRAHGPSIGVRTEALHEKHYHKVNAAERFERETKYNNETKEAIEKHTNIAKGNIGKEVVYHNPSIPELHGKTGKIVGHRPDRHGNTYGVEIDNQILGHETNQKDFVGETGWIEKNKYESRFGKGSFDKAKSEHVDKQENKNKPHDTDVKELKEESQHGRHTRLIGPKGNYGVKINDNGWATFADIHSDIHNVGKRGKHVKVQRVEIYKPNESRAAHDLGLKLHLLKTKPQTHDDVIKEIHNYVKNEGSERVSKHKVFDKEDVRGIDTNEDFGQINHKTIDLKHTKLIPNRAHGKVEVVDVERPRSHDDSGYNHSFPLSHYSRLEGIKGELEKTKSHSDVMKLLRDKKFKTESFYYDPWR